MDEVRGHDWMLSAESTATFGRVLLHARHHHMVVDGPASNGCPGEALTPAELFLGGIAACGVELIAVIARDRELPLHRVAASIGGTIDRAPGRQARDDVTTFTSVHLHLELHGVEEGDAGELVKAFKGR